MSPCGVALEGAVLTASGDTPLAWTLASGPAGFEVDPVTGAVSWTPASAQAGTQSLTVEVRNGAGADTRALSVEVTCEGAKNLRVVCGCNSGAGGTALAGLAMLLLLARTRGRVKTKP